MRFPKRAKEEDDRPAYKRIKEHIENLIRSGRLKVGDAIPPESALTEQFKVSRMTANRALRELTDEGVLVRVQGSGTFVAQRCPLPAKGARCEHGSVLGGKTRAVRVSSLLKHGIRRQL